MTRQELTADSLNWDYDKLWDAEFRGVPLDPDISRKIWDGIAATTHTYRHPLTVDSPRSVSGFIPGVSYDDIHEMANNAYKGTLLDAPLQDLLARVHGRMLAIMGDRVRPT